MAEPTSLKSLVLSLLQSLSQMEELVSGSSKRWWKSDQNSNRTRLLEAEAYACAQVLRMFHRSVLLLDEAGPCVCCPNPCQPEPCALVDSFCFTESQVDLLLDPLKSELNWPMGAKRPIDLVDSAKQTALRRFDHGNCLRGKLPFHLLDAIFTASAAIELPEPTAEQIAKLMAVSFSDRQAG